MLTDYLAATAAALAAIALWPEPPPAFAADPSEVVQTAVRLPCQAAPGIDLVRLAERLPEARSKRNWVRHSRDGIIGRRLVFDVAGDELTLEFGGATGRPDYVTALYRSGALRQHRLLAQADHSCTIHTARLLSGDAQGRPEWLQDLDDQLRPVGQPEPLNPPVPPGADPPGIPVGLIDSGVNYLLPEIAARLARDGAGEILGYDYWDLDRRPFDAEPTADPFHPDRHGTRIASLLLDGAPIAKLVPYRYPRLEPERMTSLIDHAAAQGVRLMNLSLATTNRHQWLPFEAAAKAHPEMLFVVAAGNHGRDLARYPTYPAALDLANMIVVTSAGADGRLTPGVDFGPEVVDVMAPGEDLLALDFDGVRRPVSGSSYATARVSALAACLLADHQQWTAAEIKTAVLAETVGGASAQAAHGFLSDDTLGHRGACRKVLAKRCEPGAGC